MKKTIMMSVTVALVMLTFASNASAQEYGEERYRMPSAQLAQKSDLDMGKLYLGSAILGVAGGVAGGAAGLSVASSLCGGGWSCLGPAFGGIALGGAAGTLAGSMLSLTLTGGEHTDADDIGGAFGGGLLGAAIGIPVGFFGTIAGLNMQNIPIIVGSIVAGGAAITVGTVMGYEANYGPPVRNFTVAPLVSPTHQGLVFSGRF